jgi:hypothetical protein
MKLADSDVMIDIFRNYAPALTWLKTLGYQELGIPGLVASDRRKPPVQLDHSVNAHTPVPLPTPTLD